jgi:phage portal protein BeeE
MGLRDTIAGTIARLGARVAAKSAPRLPSFGGGAGAEWQWTELARELRRIFEADRTVDYSRIDPELNSIVDGCMATITSYAAESRLRVSRRGEKGPAEDLEHPLSGLFVRPNPDLTIDEMLATTRVDINRGNAYWWKDRNEQTGDVEALWVLPRPFVRARWPMDGSEFISHYEMWTERGWVRLEKRDVIHFRRRLDRTPGADGRYGVDALKTALREVAIDDRAGDWIAVVLENHGMTSAIITPKQKVNLSREQVKEKVAQLQASVTGANRGKFLLATLALDVQKLGFDPSSMDFTTQLARAESRISFLLNIPAGFGLRVGVEAGMAKANSEEDTERLWTGNILPTERWMVSRLERDLLPEFDETTPDHFVDFDHSNVAALGENLKEAAEIADTLFSGGIVSRRTAQAIARQEVDERTPDVYCVPSGVTLYEVGQLPAPAAEPAPEPKQLESGEANDDRLDAAVAKAVRGLGFSERRALKAALEAADVDAADGAAIRYWLDHTPPSTRRLLAAASLDEGEHAA